MLTPNVVGIEWLIEVSGCDPECLRDESLLKNLFSGVIEDLGLKTVGEAIWHKFPGEGGVTGLVALSESHLACHTYPEFSTATFNLYCCRERPEWDWSTELRLRLDAKNVSVSRIERGIPESTGVAQKAGGAGEIKVIGGEQ
ncbi:MAG: S-adenosylmethionine decarboxylase [Pyrinomonadaceae bacterium]